VLNVRRGPVTINGRQVSFHKKFDQGLFDQ
jgi:hypothetical protein